MCSCLTLLVFEVIAASYARAHLPPIIYRSGGGGESGSGKYDFFA